MIYQGPQRLETAAFYAGKHDCLWGKPNNPPENEVEAKEYQIGWGVGEYIKEVAYVCNGKLD